MSSSFTMLPEWAPQEAVMLAWPHESTDWQPWLAAIQRDYVELAAAIATEVTPLILCQDEAHKVLIESQLQGRCVHAPRLVIAPYNDTWCRDYGPVATGMAGMTADAGSANNSHTAGAVAANDERRAASRMRLLDFRFNGWGDKYAADLDDDINQRLSALWAVPLRSLNFELEGGSIETDGLGTLLTTTHCLLDSNRNPDHSRADVEAFVREQLGMQRVLWLSEGALIGDDTDSHVDNLVRFCDAGTLAYATCSRIEDPHFAPLRAMAAQVQALRRPDGQPYKLHAIEIPAPLLDESGSRLPGSYVNFLIVNDSIIVPVFGCAEDAPALAELQQCFPGKRIVPVPGGNLVRQFGGPHCATMQLPMNVLNRP